jgi:hypothetical protein
MHVTRVLTKEHVLIKQVLHRHISMEDRIFFHGGKIPFFGRSGQPQSAV